MFTFSRCVAANSETSKKKSRQIIASLSVVMALVLSTWLALSGAAGQQQEEKRLIEKNSDYFPPVKITLAKTRKGQVKFEQEFLDDDEWLKGFTVQLVNASGKSVTSIDVEMTFARPENHRHEPPGAWHLAYGFSPFWFKPEETIPPPRVKPILPGDTVEITISDKDYDDLKRFLKGVRYPDKIKKIAIRVIEIGFSDGTAWNGRMYRRDPKARGGWAPIEPEGEKAHGSTLNRGDELLKLNAGDFDKREIWTILKPS